MHILKNKALWAGGGGEGGGAQPMSFGGTKMKLGREKNKNVKEQWRKRNDEGQIEAKKVNHLQRGQNERQKGTVCVIIILSFCRSGTQNFFFGDQKIDLWNNTSFQSQSTMIEGAKEGNEELKYITDA